MPCTRLPQSNSLVLSGAIWHGYLALQHTMTLSTKPCHLHKPVPCSAASSQTPQSGYMRRKDQNDTFEYMSTGALEHSAVHACPASPARHRTLWTHPESAPRMDRERCRRRTPQHVSRVLDRCKQVLVSSMPGIGSRLPSTPPLPRNQFHARRVILSASGWWCSLLGCRSGNSTRGVTGSSRLQKAPEYWSTASCCERNDRVAREGGIYKGLIQLKYLGARNRRARVLAHSVQLEEEG